ncbi:hypothetical protein C4J93_3626 [Pseudomonas sp. R2-37-08W]|nr:hypothetical protein C4J93_3626 [Pseudomonas sp. R2-37-08W]
MDLRRLGWIIRHPGPEKPVSRHFLMKPAQPVGGGLPSIAV